MQTIQKTLLCLVLSLALLFCSTPVLAADMPGPNPNYEEMTLETFLERYPDYAGREDPRFPSGMTPAAIDNPGYVTSNYSGPFTWEGDYDTKIWYLYSGIGSDRVKVTSGSWYHEVKDGNDHWYYLYAVGATKYDGTKSNGEAAIGWEKLGKYWYHFNQYGQMATYWVPVSGVYYYFAPPSSSADTISGYPEGAMLTGAWYLPVTQGSTSYRNYYFNAYGAMQDWYYPLDKSLEQNRYINRNIRTDGHNGMDIDSYWEAPIYNAVAGKVLYAKYYGTMGQKDGTGYSVIAQASTSPTLYVRYFHMSQAPLVKPNATIAEGVQLGLVGNTGKTYGQGAHPGKHLHIDVSEVRAASSSTGTPLNLSQDDARNPAAFFPSIEFKGSSPIFGANLN